MLSGRVASDSPGCPGRIPAGIVRPRGSVRKAEPWTTPCSSTSTCSAKIRCPRPGTTSSRTCPLLRRRPCTPGAWIRSAPTICCPSSRSTSSCRRSPARGTSRFPVVSSMCIASGGRRRSSARIDLRSCSAPPRAFTTSTRVSHPPDRTSPIRRCHRPTTTRRMAPRSSRRRPEPASGVRRSPSHVLSTTLSARSGRSARHTTRSPTAGS